MLDAPPTVPIDLTDTQKAVVESHLPIEERADGSLLIDLKPLAPKPLPETCVKTDPNPLENGIIVCRVLTTDQRLGPQYGPANTKDDFASAIPRAKVRFSDDATGELNGTNPSVGGFNAQGAEVKIKIGF